VQVRAYNTLVPRPSGAGSHSLTERYGVSLLNVECISTPYNVPAASSYMRSARRKSYCRHGLAHPRCISHERAASSEGRHLLRDLSEALTLIRKRRRIGELYRINDIR
jgi:hypothetical protein